MSTSRRAESFHSIYTHGFFRVAAATSLVWPGQPDLNANEIVTLSRQASEQQVGLIVFPELSLSGYSIDDLFHQDALLTSVETALLSVVDASKELAPILVIGAPLRIDQRLFNCAVVIYRGEIFGIVPKTYLPSYREFYEKRYFCSAEHAVSTTARLSGTDIPFGRDLIFEVPACPGFAMHVEICEDLWVPVPPSSRAALSGATVLANLSASNVTTGKADYRRLLCASQSGRCVAGYLYAGAGYGESTTDLCWDGHMTIYENGELLAESVRFATGSHWISADLDLAKLCQERLRLTSFHDCAQLEQRPMRRVAVPFTPAKNSWTLQRAISRYPYVPAGVEERAARCREVFEIQVQGLMRRLEGTGIKKALLGISGGIDSTQALLVTTVAFDRLGYPRQDILAYTLPSLATSKRTRSIAWRLMQYLEVGAHEIDITQAASDMLVNIHHPAGEGDAVYDTTFENVQAGERAAYLFRLANFHQGLVVGTSNLSELALGYTTYGVGDHMSHYNVNASVPKTLMRPLVRWAVDEKIFATPVLFVLDAILTAPSSPELIPSQRGKAQNAEAEIGPYELHDFFLYHLSRFGFAPSKIAFLAQQAWAVPNQDAGGDSVQQEPTHDLAAIKHWLEFFLRRFISTSQFKRSAMPNGPKIGSGGSLSPRSDWRAPSDISATAWIDELQNIP
ncbi:NAD(+) synthase [Dongia soli]|uniref:Glutamine-dependent NAD(+) synthetase n=1 Tax=Dongia soli TaxID=600628 RepID=A0ABU5EEA1_9PROT|nr:NAD(+) synthase [Dongia soli]MDY0884680.1 NAD(+) synthase [Dongia soli]